jgi:integrase
VGRGIEKLTAMAVTKAKKVGLYADGGGLYLQVTKRRSHRSNGKASERQDGVTKSWVFRFMLNGRAREMGLGPLHAVSLMAAREAATECRRLRHRGIDPIEHRRAGRHAERLDAAKAVTFKSAGEQFIKAQRPGWRNAKHAGQWETTLVTYAHPVIGALSVRAIDTALVLKVLEPIWTIKAETASRLRGRIESVLDWAKVRGYRDGENPARWRGHLDKLLPARSKVRRVVHHAALPYVEVPDFMEALRQQDGTAARALEFTILTASRAGETVGAKWPEINMTEKVWIIPPSRMKSAREHRVPLSGGALAILKEAQKHSGEFIFAAGKVGRPLNDKALRLILKRMGRGDVTTHGFRSSFRDWAAERTNYAREVVEMALAHAVESKVEAAYRRSDLLDRRRRLMEEWARHCMTVKHKNTGDVVSIAR